MMSCRTGELDRAQVEAVLAGMGWCPDHPGDSAYIQGKMAGVLARLPDSVRAELAARDPVLITTFPHVWGLASFDRRQVLVLCLLDDDLDVIKQQCTQIAVHLPGAFARTPVGGPYAFDPHVEIRRYDGNELVTRGVISETGQVRFGRYLWSVRRRERLTLTVLTAVFAISTALSIVLYLRYPGADWAYARGYLDRIGGAIVIAALVTLINLVFEYRDWKGSAAVIEWSPQAR